MSYRYSKTKIQGFIDNIRYKEVTLSSTKSSGAGGQHINKTESKVQLSRNIKSSSIIPEPYKSKCMELYANSINEAGEIRIDAQVHRSQADNKELVRKKLSTMINNAFKPPKAPRKLTTAPKHAVDARIAEKKRTSRTRSLRTKIR